MCKGPCYVQYYDVDLTGITYKLVANQPDYCNPGGKPDEEQVADALQSYYEKVGCEEAGCFCSLFPGQTPTWTNWLTYDAPSDPVKVFIGKPGDLKSCDWTLTGTYKVSSCLENGVCMKKPKDWTDKPPARHKNPKRPKAN